MWELGCEESWAQKNWCFWTVVLEKTLESSLDCKEIQPVHRSVLGVPWKDWCWSCNCNILATWCKELTYLKRPWVTELNWSAINFFNYLRLHSIVTFNLPKLPDCHTSCSLKTSYQKCHTLWAGLKKERKGWAEGRRNRKEKEENDEDNEKEKRRKKNSEILSLEKSLKN